jgi:chemotaxis family two-component system sensor kinase Cph1
LIHQHVGDQAPEKLNDYVRRAREAGGRLNHLTNDILALWNSGCTSAAIPLQSVPVTPIFQSLNNTFDLRAVNHEIHLRLLVQGQEPLAVWADPGLLERALENLLTNALKFTPKGGTVSVMARRGDRGVYFDVADTGRGIPSDAQSSIFQPHTQLQPEDREQGFGLGLPIVKWIVEAHQGRLLMESVVGQGSRFLLWFPDRPLIPLQVTL